MRRFDHFISLGGTCGAKYQIGLNGFRRDRPAGAIDEYEDLLYGRKTADIRGRSTHFFDWIVSPFPSVVRLIATRFECVFERENLEITGQGSVVRDRAFDLRFFHDFHGAGPVLTPRELNAQYRHQRSKFMYYRDKFLKLLRSDERVLYVVSLPPRYRLAELASFHEALAAHHPRHRYVLLAVRHSRAAALQTRLTRLRRETRREIVCEVTTASPKPARDRWSFNDAAWQSVLNRYGWRKSLPVGP